MLEACGPAAPHLRAVTAGDVDALYELNSDPRLWEHLPAGVHTERGQTRDQVTRWQAAWKRDGLGYRTVWLEDGTFVGIGGSTVNRWLAWNLCHRVTPATHGRGYGTVLAVAARRTASKRRPELPVTALLLEHNVAPGIVAERCADRRLPDGPIGSPVAHG